MTAQPAHRLRMTPEEYFAWEEKQEVKHEYYHGEVFAMAGGTDRHALITANLVAALSNALRGSGCRVYSGDLRVQLTEGTRYVYPDLSVVCCEPRFVSEKRQTLINPSLVVEVLSPLSPSSEDYDRGGKFAAYRGVPSLREYVLVAQDRKAVEVFRRNDEGRWTLYEPEDGAVELASVEAALRVEEVYEGVDFTDLPSPHPRAADAA